MDTNKAPYGYLTEPFQHWIQEKLSKYYEELEQAFFHGQRHKALLEKIGISELEFYERFLKPYEGMNPEQLSSIAVIQTELGHKYLKSYTHFLAKPVLEQYMNSIEWTILNISDLNLQGLNVEPEENTDSSNQARYLKEPYNQCRSCGRPNQDPRETSFGYRGLKRCKINDADTENRPCSDEWQKFFDVARDGINKRKTADSIDYFILKCQERFEFNLQHVPWTIGNAINCPQLIGTFIGREQSYV